MRNSKSIFTATPLDKNDVQLGSLVPDKRYPHQNALSKKELDPDKDFTNNLDRNFSSRMNDEKRTHFRATITRLLSGSLATESGNTIQVSSLKARIYELRQPDAIFEELCKGDDVKKWLESRYRKGDKPRFVMGYRTLEDAKLAGKEHHSVKASAEGSLPTGIITGVDPTPSGEMDVKAKLEHESKHEAKGEYETVGERIYAICYRKILIKFRTGIVDASLKADNCWKTFSATRGAENVTDEFVQVTLNDEDDSSLGESEAFQIGDEVEEFLQWSPESEAEDEEDEEDEEEEGEGEGEEENVYYY